MTCQSHTVSTSRYGARVVSVDTFHRLFVSDPVARTEAPDAMPAARPALGQTWLATAVSELNAQQVSDRLALAHWPWGHQLVVCSLAGGVGRTTVSGLLATVLAELTYAHIWPPVALVEESAGPLSRTSLRWDVRPVETDADAGADVAFDSDDPSCTRSGVWVFTGGQPVARREDFSTLVIDALPGLPSSHHLVALDPRATILLLVRPDRASLAEAADALVWMHDYQLLSRHRVVVLINHTHSGPVDPASRAAATGLEARCAGVHRLLFDPALGPGRPLPCGRNLPDKVRQTIARTALNLWMAATAAPTRNIQPDQSRPVEHKEFR